ncbi:ABC transporter substrate-binding protein [Paeniroseomonas aquatica]|uniref:ABC transporter substrate-binding protein n=1 Tax=Paeniroseomonas aquatica TaxID=373043 RepID=UPI00360ED312
MRPMTLLEPFRALFYAPFYLAEARGSFAAQGLALRLVTAGTTDRAAAMLLAGEADLAWSGPMRPLLLRSQDPSCTLRSFCAVVMRDPFLLAGAAPRSGFRLQDLPGLRLGLVSEVPTPGWCLRGILPGHRSTSTPRTSSRTARWPGMSRASPTATSRWRSSSSPMPARSRMPAARSGTPRPAAARPPIPASTRPRPASPPGAPSSWR